MLESVFHKDPTYNDLPAEAKDFKMLEYLVLLGASTNHVHLLLQIDTKRPICKSVEIIKSISSKKFKKLSGSSWHGWQNGYFISSVGRSTKSKVKKYLENQ